MKQKGRSWLFSPLYQEIPPANPLALRCRRTRLQRISPAEPRNRADDRPSRITPENSDRYFTIEMERDKFGRRSPAVRLMGLVPAAKLCSPRGEELRRRLCALRRRAMFIAIVAGCSALRRRAMFMASVAGCSALRRRAMFIASVAGCSALRRRAMFIAIVAGCSALRRRAMCF